MTAARTSLPSSAIIIRRYTGKPTGRYRASPGRLRREVICSSPRPPSLRRRLNRTTAGMSSSAAKRMFMVTTPRPSIRYSLELFPELRPVDFTVGVFRELFIEGHPFRRHHVIRQYFAQLFPQHVRSNLGARLRRIGATDRHALEPIAVDSHDRALFQSVDGVQGGLDLSQLDPISSTLDLRVGPPQEIDQAVGVDPGQVASLKNDPRVHYTVDSPDRDRGPFVLRTFRNRVVTARDGRLCGTVEIGEAYFGQSLHPVN